MSKQQLIEQKIRQGLTLTFLDVSNESDGHNVAPGSETHFKVVVVSADFEGVKPVARHRKIYELVEADLKQGVHALALHIYTPVEWLAVGGAPVSPNCLGGSKS